MQYIMLLILFFFIHCQSSQEIMVDSRLGKPDQESWGVTIFLTEEGMIKAKIQSGHLEVSGDEGPFRARSWRHVRDSSV